MPSPRKLAPAHSPSASSALPQLHPSTDDLARGAAERQPRLSERLIAACLHLLVTLVFIGPFLTFIVWVWNRRRSPFIAYHARQAVLWQSLMNICVFLLLGLFLVIAFTSFGDLIVNNARNDGALARLFGSFLGLYALAIVALLFFWLSAAVGAIGALLGKRFRYPLVNSSWYPAMR